MMHLRGSLGSEMSLPWPRPREAFHLFRASSSLSVAQSQQCCSGKPKGPMEIWRSWMELLTQVLVLIERLLLTDLEALGLLCVEIVVLLGHGC
jgi:hypothetical protein